MDFQEERKWRKRKEKAIASGNLASTYVACKELAEFYHREEKFDEALKEYKVAERVAKKMGNKMNVGVANRMIGEVLCCLGEFDEAIKHQRRHLELSREERNLVEEQRALATLGRTFFVKAESCVDEDSSERRTALYSSQRYYKESLAVCDNLENTVALSQLMIMKARLYINLGLTLESEQSERNSSEAIKLYEKAITVCNRMEFWDELCRGYTVLGTAYFHKKDSAASLRAYDNALKIATKSDTKIPQSCEILLAKSDVLVALNDLTGAKQVLLKAYKLKNPNPKDRKEIERRARIVVAMCDAEDKLISTSIDDYKARKELHEKVADGFVALSNYMKAIEHYQKMLQCAEDLGQSGKELIPCYVSLSQTYKDNKQYDLAYEYFEKELAVNADNPTEACKTLINMAVTLELQHKSLDEILSVYEKARDKAKLISDFKLEATVLEAMLAVQNERGCNVMIDRTKRALDDIKSRLNNDESEGEDEDSEEGESGVVEIGADICLSDLTDSDDNEEFDRPNRPVRKRTVRSTTLMKRNEKGETPLHVACEKGSLTLVKNLINQGHPLDVQDAAGWLPLHEACNHGHVKVVEALLDAGADINDRGGAGCEGITPLHDAASSGHLDVIDLLLDRGASPLVKTNKGETVLDCLLACRERVVSESGKELDPVSLSHFESIVSRLRACLEKVGESTQSKPKKPSRTLNDSSQGRRENIRFRPSENNLRTSIDVIEDDATAAIEYQKTIRALRHKSARPQDKQVEPKQSDIPAFLDSQEVGNDWLDDDLMDFPQPPKKRSNDYVGQAYRQASSSSVKKRTQNLSYERPMDYAYPTKRKRNSSCSSDDDADNRRRVNQSDSPLRPLSSNTNSSEKSEIEEPFIAEADSTLRISDPESPPASPELIHRPSHTVSLQRTLTQFNFTDSGGSCVNDDQSNQAPTSNHEDGYNRFDYNESFNDFNPVLNGDNRMKPGDLNKTTGSMELEPLKDQYIKVSISGEVITVPMPDGKEKDERGITLNVAWLITEVKKFFKCEEGRVPELTLKTSENVPLYLDDSLTLYVNNREILGEVSSWHSVSLLEQYHELCHSENVVVDSVAETPLELCQASSCLEIKNSSLKERTLELIFKVISRYSLKSLTLSVLLYEDMFKSIMESLSLSPHLNVLNLSNTGISVEEISLFAEVPENIWQNLRYLNLSHNPLGNESVAYLNDLIKAAPSLRSLNLENCDLTQGCAEVVQELLLESVEDLNISYNRLDIKGLLIFFRCLDPTCIKSLNIAAVGSNAVLREFSLFFDGHDAENLKSINLSHLSLTDSDLEIFVNSLKSAKNLEHLNVMDNPELTVKSFHSLRTSFENLKTLLFSGADFGDIDHELLDKFSRCTFSSSSKNYPPQIKRPYGFISKGGDLEIDKFKNSAAEFIEDGLDGNPNRLNDDHLENKLDGALKRDSNCDIVNNLDDSFDFDLNCSFEDNLLVDNSDKKMEVDRGSNEQLRESTSKFNDSLENLIDDDMENKNLFEDSD